MVWSNLLFLTIEKKRKFCIEKKIKTIEFTGLKNNRTICSILFLTIDVYNILK